MKTERLQLLDALKGYAILGVVLVHMLIFSKINVAMPYYLSTFIRSGMFAVQMFFMLSAFGLLLSDKPTSSIQNISFLLRRLIRLLPLYYAMLAVFVVVGFIYPVKPFSFLDLIAHVFLIHSLSPLWINSIHPAGWYVSDILFMYLTVMIFAKEMVDLNKILVLFFLSIIFYLGATICLTNSHIIHDKEIMNNFMYMWYPAQLPVFLLGGIAVAIYKTKTFQINKPSIVIIFIIILLWLFISLIGISIPMHLKYAVIYSILTLFLIKYPIKLVVNKVVCFIGKRSYSIYLSHLLVIYGLREVVFKTNYGLSTLKLWILFALLSISISIAISLPLFEIFERRIPEYLLKIVFPLNGKRAAHYS